MTPRGRIAAWLVDAAAILGTWLGLLIAENIALGFLWRDQFSGIWELAIARRYVVPLATAGLAPLAPAVAAGWHGAVRARSGSRLAICILGSIGGLGAGALGLGLTVGRHFANPTLRLLCVGLLVLAGAAAAARTMPHITRLRNHPVRLTVLGATLAFSAWLGDVYLLPRLYPAFHNALFVLILAGAALAALSYRSDETAPGRLAKLCAFVIALVVVRGAWTARGAMEAFDRAANLRLVLSEHAPLLGRAVAVAVRWHPPEDIDAFKSGSTDSSATPGEVARSLDWVGHDIVLLTVDALRADHVSAYGYARATTPNIDALARDGTLFEQAYCPTPHTSYSVTSLMTGKYLRPLLALGLGEDSETWAQELRRYGWRTAAFYPPAVFFVDESRFERFEHDHLGFEYAKVEFADPTLRERQISVYLTSAPPDRPLFLWVHFFEPHEPYVLHPDHPFAGASLPDIDAYDSEVATADDGIGRVVRLVRERRTTAPVVIITADHGEEFGEHGGRYHGTTVYEEQVRVPLVISGPGVRSKARQDTVIGTIDLLPTVLSALGIPRPAPLRGRDLGPLLSGHSSVQQDPGFAFAETDDYALVAAGADRLVCQRRVAACGLFRPSEDPLEHRDRGPGEPGRLAQLRALLWATERDHGRYEAGGTASWPEALRRGLQGEADAAADVASLLDDADVTIRRQAAKACFLLHAPITLPELKRASVRDEDDEVRRWTMLALTRLGEAESSAAVALLRDPVRDWRQAAALALGERADPRACSELAAAWSDAWPATSVEALDHREPPQLALELAQIQELLAATASARCRTAVPALVRALEDVRARPYVVDALGALGDERARAPLLDQLSDEPYVTTRPHEARALLALGVHDWLAPASLAKAQVVLAPSGSWTRVALLVSDPNAVLTAAADGAVLSPGAQNGEVRMLELRSLNGRRVRINLGISSGSLVALWLLPQGRLD
ncbi:MAG: sulfatase-like hydrolase/transferase [Polyangiaceae bacterium]|jgi:arylsulfatase A-like enzyme